MANRNQDVRNPEEVRKQPEGYNPREDPCGYEVEVDTEFARELEQNRNDKRKKGEYNLQEYS